MKVDPPPVIVIEQSKNDESNFSVEEESFNTKNIEATHHHFFKITQCFGLEAPLLPTRKQIPISERSNKRERLTKQRKQKNIEEIIMKTFAFSANQPIDKRTDLDWFDRYISLAENVSNTTMQDLWAKILSGELARPGLYSLKALKVFREMSIVDAKLLAKACSLAVKDSSKKNIRIISGAYQQPDLFNFFNQERQQHLNLSHFGLNYADILSLAENKLLFKQENESNIMKRGETLNFYYNGSPLKLSSKKNKIALQFYKFTPIGSELANLITDKPNEEFLSVLKQKLAHHFTVVSNEP